MTEDEWYAKGNERLQEWRDDNDPYLITPSEADAFEYAWELAGRELGVVE